MYSMIRYKKINRLVLKVNISENSNNGDLIEGYPIQLDEEIVGSIVFADLYGDGSTSKIIGTSAGKIYAFDEDNESLQYFPAKLFGSYRFFL